MGCDAWLLLKGFAADGEEKQPDTKHAPGYGAGQGKTWNWVGYLGYYQDYIYK